MNREIRRTAKMIKSLKIQGATAICRTLLLALKNYGLRIKTKNLKIWQKKFKENASFLLSQRPTEPLAQNGVRFIFSSLKEGEAQNVAQAKNYLKKAVEDFLLLSKDAAEIIIRRAEKIVKNNDKIFTHCHSSLVEQTLSQAKKSGKKFEVFNTETRPLFQGRITARKLLQAGVETTMVADSSSGFLISKYSGKNLMMDKVFLGADALLKNGSVINKIGSFGIGLAAANEKVPLYIISSLLKYHPSSWIKIEKRGPGEIWPGAPKKLKIINFAFDSIPAQFIKGIVTEAGIIKPKDVSKTAKRIYPWI